jgi:hypothetical protein
MGKIPHHKQNPPVLHGLAESEGVSVMRTDLLFHRKTIGRYKYKYLVASSKFRTTKPYWSIAYCTME